MGIISDKKRILDTILTQNGRAQVATGKLRTVFYSFSDADVPYSKEDQYASGSDHFKMVLEASQNAKDLITFESDDSGKLKVREFLTVNSSSLKVIDGKIFSGSLPGNTRIVAGTDEDFSGLVSGLLAKSLENFKNQRIIGSPDLHNNLYDEFLISKNFAQFKVTEESPIPSQILGGTQDANINNIESLFADKKLSHIPNFKYLPPVNKPRLGTRLTTPLGIYPHVGQEPIYEFSDLRKELKECEDKGYMVEVNFYETSKANTLFGQFFEVSDGALSKLDIIDFGIFSINENEMTDEEYRQAIDESRELTMRHVYFVGKLFLDENGSHTFVNLFTIVFEN